MEQRNSALSQSAKKEKIVRALLLAAVVAAAIAIAIVFLKTTIGVGIKGGL